MKHIKSALSTVALLCLVGCASVNKQTLAPEAASALKDQTLVQTKRPAPDFVALTPSKAAIALIGAALAVSEGNAMVAGHAIQDPAQIIASGLADAMAGTHGIKLLTQPLIFGANDAGDVSKASESGARYVLDVQTLGWAFGYFPTDWTHYRVIYSAKARLIDTKTKATVAEGHCQRTPESNVGAPTYEELTDNGAARIKQELAVAAGECIKALKTDMLML